jgi:hypothetical protein
MRVAEVEGDIFHLSNIDQGEGNEPVSCPHQRSEREGGAYFFGPFVVWVIRIGGRKLGDLLPS